MAEFFYFIFPHSDKSAIRMQVSQDMF